MEFQNEQSVNTMHVYFFSDGSGVQLPEDCEIQYWTGKKWEYAEMIETIPEALIPNALNIFRFKELKTTKVRLIMDHLSEEAFSGIYELELYGD